MFFVLFSLIPLILSYSAKSTADCSPPSTSSRVGDILAMPSHDNELPAAFETHDDSCLLPKGDRLAVVPRASLPAGTSVSQEDGVAFLAQDLCAMGHSTKDPAVLLTYLMLKPADERLTYAVYGHQCMTRVAGSGNNKRSPVWHNVLIHWFRAVLHVPNGDTAVRELHYEDISKERPLCLKKVIKRGKEIFRWFARPAHCVVFQTRLAQYFNLTETPRAPSEAVRITILRRDEDRHFDEIGTYDYLKKVLDPQLATVQLVTFDRVRSGPKLQPPTHAEQLRILRETDVLIAAHGAGLSSVAMLRPGGRSVVIELFPNNFRYPMYEELSLSCGIRYISIESPVVWPKHCCKGRTTADMEAIRVPSDVQGVGGARSCKKCDIFVERQTWVAVITSAVGTVLGL